LEGLLTVVVLAMLCGKNSVKGVARWAREYRWECAARVGFPRGRTPSLGTFQRVIAAVDDEELARVVGHWGEDALPAVHVLVLVEIGSRRVHLAGCTPIRTMPGLRNKRGK
jgi:hypothetical protein